MTTIDFFLILVVAFGTYLLRLLPFKASLIKSTDNKSDSKLFDKLFEVAGVCIIAALLVGSFAMPAKEEMLKYLICVSISSIVVTVACLKWKNPGIGVVSGITIYALLNFII